MVEGNKTEIKEKVFCDTCQKEVDSVVVRKMLSVEYVYIECHGRFYGCRIDDFEALDPKVVFKKEK